MIVSKQWLNEFIDLSSESSKSISEALNTIGLEVDSIRDISIAKGVVVGRVKECKKHPDATKLNICKVDIGTEILQIVCGASNVTKNQYVAVATVGTMLGEDFLIKDATLRGVESIGMICSSSEIGLGKINDGIMVLDDSIGKLVLGKELNKYERLNDTVIDIELTANRGDCQSVYGIAKDLGAYFSISLKALDTKIKYSKGAIGRILNITHTNNISSNLLYQVADISKFSLSLLYQLRVAFLGIQKNTQIETLVTYCTHSTGILLNVYTKNSASENDKIELNIYNDTNNFTNVDGKQNLSKVGILTSNIVNEDTKIVIEASYSEPTALAQNVFTSKQKTSDVYYKSSRGSNPDLEFGMDYIANILSIQNSQIYKGRIDLQSDILPETLTIDLTKLNKIIGQSIKHLQIENILISLGFIVKHKVENKITIIVPISRHDIKNIADVSEEIVRMVGIDNIKAKPLCIDAVNRTNKISNDLIKLNKLRSSSVANSFFETVTYVYSSKDLLLKYGFEVVNANLDILNPINGDLNTFRTNMYLNLLQAVNNNEKQGFKSISLFEKGIIFDEKRNESKQLAFVFSGQKENESLQNSGKVKNITLFEFAQKITNVIGEFELEIPQKINDKFFHPYQCANVIQNNKIIGQLFKIHPNVSNDFDISSNTYLASIDFDLIEDKLVQVDEISKYQISKRDLSIVVDKNLEYKKIKNLIDSLKLKNLVQYNLIDIYTDEKLENKESLTIKFVLQSSEKTLEEEDINAIMDTIIKKLETKLDIYLR